MIYRLKIDYAHRELGRKHHARWSPGEKLWILDTDGELPEELKRYVVVEEQTPSGAQDYIARMPDSSIPTDFAKYRTVKELTQFIRGVYTQLPAFRSVMVRGEVTNCNPPRGNGPLFFSLKEGEQNDQALINCVLWKNELTTPLFELKNGQQVALEGKLDFYGGSGRTQISVRRLYDIGAGEAALKLAALRRKLEELGWFAPELKKPVPAHPRRIGIVTSQSGQAIQDFESTARKRNPYVQLELCPVSVQGVYAVQTIVRGIEFMDERGYDLIIVGRGGGSEEELYVFNDEAIVTAVHNAETPIVSAVGHTGNFTLIDAVADGFANTPTGAIEKYVPDLQSDLDSLHHLQRLFRNNMERVLSAKKESVGSLHVTLERLTPLHRIHTCSEHLRQNTSALESTFRTLLHNRNMMIADVNRTLEKHRPDMLIQQRNADIRLSVQTIQNRAENIFTAAERRYALALTALQSFRIDTLTEDYRRSTAQLETNISERMRRILDAKIHDYRITVTELHGKSPTAKLVNGFGYITHDEMPVLSAAGIHPGDELTLTLHDGRIHAETRSTEYTQENKDD